MLPSDSEPQMFLCISKFHLLKASLDLTFFYIEVKSDRKDIRFWTRDGLKVKIRAYFLKISHTVELSTGSQIL